MGYVPMSFAGIEKLFASTNIGDQIHIPKVKNSDYFKCPNCGKQHQTISFIKCEYCGFGGHEYENDWNTVSPPTREETWITYRGMKMRIPGPPQPPECRRIK